MLRITLALLLLAGCASTTPSTTHRDIAADHREEAVKRMQDEFNEIFRDAS